MGRGRNEDGPVPLGTGAAISIAKEGYTRGLFRVLQCAEFNVDEIDFEFLFGFDADEERTSLSCCDDFIGVVDTLEEQCVCSLEFTNDKFGELRKVDVALLLIKDVLGEFSDTFGICFRFEHVSLVLKDGLQFAVIGDDTIVDDNKLSFRITPTISYVFP